MSNQPIVILGTGLAGYTLAREFRKLDADAPLMLISADDGAFYSKPMLSNALAQGKTATQLANSDAGKMAEQLKAQILAHTRVSAIDPDAHTLTADGKTIPYSKLVIAAGADPIRIPLQGNAADEVLSVNDLADYARFRERLEGRKRVLILGAGLIGCEFANDMIGTGIEVDVVDLAPLPLGRLVPEAAGIAMRDALQAIGVNWHLDTSIRTVESKGDGYRVTLANDEVVDTDLVLSAVGLRPRTQLADASGLATARGIQVDRELRASNPDIFALGDCAEIDGLVLPFVMPIMHAARALAKTLAGTTTPVNFPAMPVVVKTPALPTVVAPPARAAAGDWQVETLPDNGIRARFVNAEGALLGFTLCGEASKEKQALSKELPATLG